MKNLMRMQSEVPMAIQPIDLQTLFTQIDKVGKDQANLKEGAALQHSLQSVQIQKKTEERAQTVNETQDTGQGVERIKDRNNRKRPDQESVEQEEDSEASDKAEEAADPSVIRDPALGKNIDFSG
jgi:hypothetical protein